MRKVEARLDIQIIQGTRETLGHTDTREEQKTSKQTGHVGKRKTKYKLTKTKFSLGIQRKLLVCISKGGNCSN